MERNKNLMRALKIGTIFFVIILSISIIAIIMFKYEVEGEQNLPFNLNKVVIVSTADKVNSGTDINIENLLQKNNIYFYIEKNAEYKKEKSIKSVTFNNFNINKENDKGQINVYIPSENNNKYNYSQKFINNNIKYIGAIATSTGNLEIANQGGCIGFSIATNNLGTYQNVLDEIVSIDGTLLKKNEIIKEDINFNVTFDLIIETEDNIKYKANIKLDLPIGNILEDGICSIEDNNLKDLVFKRV